MSSSVATRALAAGLGVFLLAGSARAGAFSSFVECDNPSGVWVSVLASIEDSANVDFGSLSQKVCSSIVKKGVANCKFQTKSAAKCNDHTADSNYQIQLKQCNELATKQDRSNCKTSYKNELKSIKNGTKANRNSGLAACDAQFSDELMQDCVNGVPM